MQMMLYIDIVETLFEDLDPVTEFSLIFFVLSLLGKNQLVINNLGLSNSMV